MHHLLLELVSPVPVVRKVMNKITSKVSSYIWAGGQEISLYIL